MCDKSCVLSTAGTLPSSWLLVVITVIATVCWAAAVGIPVSLVAPPRSWCGLSCRCASGLPRPPTNQKTSCAHPLIDTPGTLLGSQPVLPHLSVLQGRKGCVWGPQPRLFALHCLLTRAFFIRSTGLSTKACSLTQEGTYGPNSVTNCKTALDFFLWSCKQLSNSASMTATAVNSQSATE